MSFFDEPEPAPPPDYGTPEWIAPPENVIPATVALDVVLRRLDLAIWVADALVFPSGLSFGINVHCREQASDAPLFFEPVDPDGLRFGVQLAHGRKVIVQRLGEMKPFPAAARQADPATTLRLRRGPPGSRRHVAVAAAASGPADVCVRLTGRGSRGDERRD